MDSINHCDITPCVWMLLVTHQDFMYDRSEAPYPVDLWWQTGAREALRTCAVRIAQKYNDTDSTLKLRHCTAVLPFCLIWAFPNPSRRRSQTRYVSHWWPKRTAAARPFGRAAAGCLKNEINVWLLTLVKVSCRLVETTTVSVTDHVA